MNRVDDKKKWEVNQGALVAQAINTAQAADYKAEPADREPADVVLASRSGRFPPLHAQVVSIPLDFRYRDDKQSVQRVQQRITERLNAAGIKDALVGLILSGSAEMHGIDRALLEKIIELIIERGRRDNIRLSYVEINQCSAEMAGKPSRRTIIAASNSAENSSPKKTSSY